MKKFIAISILAMFAVLSFDCYAQTNSDKTKETICNSDATRDLPGTRTELKGYVKDQCNNAKTGNVGAAIERAMYKAAKENASSNTSNGGRSNSSSYSSSNSNSSGSNTGSSNGNRSGGSTTNSNSRSGNSGAGASASNSCTSCSSQASALRNSRNK